LANTNPHQLSLGDREKGITIPCTEGSQVAGLIQKSIIFSCSCPSFKDCSNLNCHTL